MFEADDENGDVVRGMVVERVFLQLRTRHLCIVDLMNKINSTLVANDVPELNRT